MGAKNSNKNNDEQRQTEKIFVAGHRGMVGSAIVQELQQQGYSNLILRTRDQLDLTQQTDVEQFFDAQKVDRVYLAAAKVGGIYANNQYPADFIYENLSIANNIIHSAYTYNVKQLLFLGSSCIYPKFAEQPIREESILTGQLESTNEPYAIAKIAGIKLCESYNRQHNTDFRSIMPSNLYGVNDNFHPKNSHVIASLIRRFHEAKINRADSVTVWGTGKVKREFLYIEDLAKAAVHVMDIAKEEYKKITKPMLSHINVGTGVDVTIAELAQLIKTVVGFEGKIIWDHTMPDGTPRKVLNIDKVKQLGWQPKFELSRGLTETYRWFQKSENKRSV